MNLENNHLQPQPFNCLCRILEWGTSAKGVEKRFVYVLLCTIYILANFLDATHPENQTPVELIKTLPAKCLYISTTLLSKTTGVLPLELVSSGLSRLPSRILS